MEKNDVLKMLNSETEDTAFAVVTEAERVRRSTQCRKPAAGRDLATRSRTAYSKAADEICQNSRLDT